MPDSEEDKTEANLQNCRLEPYLTMRNSMSACQEAGQWSLSLAVICIASTGGLIYYQHIGLHCQFGLLVA